MLIRNIHRKLLKHWAQSWLLGVPVRERGFLGSGIDKLSRPSRLDSETMMAFSSLNGHSRQRRFPPCGFSPCRISYVLISISIASLPRPPWHPSPSHQFLYSVLNLVVSDVLPTDPTPLQGLPENEALPPAIVWRFSFIPRRGCELYQVGKVATHEGRWGGVLPEEYVRWRMRRR